jgi:hypothetical protein
MFPQAYEDLRAAFQERAHAKRLRAYDANHISVLVDRDVLSIVDTYLADEISDADAACLHRHFNEHWFYCSYRVYRDPAVSKPLKMAHIDEMHALAASVRRELKRV